MRQDRSGRTLGKAHAADRLKLRASTTPTPARWRGCCICPLKHGKKQDCDAIRCTLSPAGLFWRHRRRPPCARAAPIGSFQCWQGIGRGEDLQVSHLPPSCLAQEPRKAFHSTLHGGLISPHPLVWCDQSASHAPPAYRRTPPNPRSVSRKHSQMVLFVLF